MNSYSFQKTTNKQKYEEYLENAIVDFQKYFNIKLKSEPCLIFLKSRQEFNDVMGCQTFSWVTGYNNSNLIFLMDESIYEAESSKEYNSQTYILSVKHELLHQIFRQITGINRPVWLSEGFSLYFSGQIKFSSRPEKFTDFLLFEEKTNLEDKSVYRESGFVVELLMNKFGKEKLLELMPLIKSCHNNQEFKKIFKKVYGFDLNYKNINKFYLP